MPGLGNYKKGKTLKSGNTPAFKMMAQKSPITETPYKQDAAADSDGEDKKEKGGGWKKALSIGIGALTGGLDAVYGTGKVMPKSSDRLKKKPDAKKEETTEEK